MGVVKATLQVLFTLASCFGVIVFAGVFKHIFMGLCFFGIFCCLVTFFYQVNKDYKEN